MHKRHLAQSTNYDPELDLSICEQSLKNAPFPNKSTKKHCYPDKMLTFLLIPFNVGLKSLLHQGLEFYGDLVYKFKKIRGKTDFSDQFRKIIMRYKRIGYNLNVMRQSACLVINPITVDS